MKLGRESTFVHKRQKVLDLLPDVCLIRKHTLVATTDGGYDDTGLGSPIIYNGSQFVPCRFDVSNRFTNQMGGNQETVNNQFIFNCPFDFPLETEMQIEHISNPLSSTNHKYEISQLMDDVSFRVTKQAIAVRLNNA